MARSLCWLIAVTVNQIILPAGGWLRPVGVAAEAQTKVRVAANAEQPAC